MSKRSLLFALTLVLSLTVSSRAFSAEPPPQPPAPEEETTAETPSDSATDANAPGEAANATEEKPPTPEPPYPGAEESEFAADASMVPGQATTATPPSAAGSIESVPTPEPEITLPRPVKIDDEENYYYDTRIDDVPVTSPAEIARPKKTAKTGEFFYNTDDPPNQFSGNPEIEAPSRITSDGAYHYKVERKVNKAAASFRFGIVSPPAMTNPDNGLTFEDVYGDAQLPLLLIDYEWRLTSKIGRLSLNFGSGLLFASGQGRFKNVSRLGETPDEHFTFLMFPNQLTLAYKFQYADTQLFVPYVEGGGGYFTFAELRDDGKHPKLGAAPVGVAAAGVSLLLDRLDPSVVGELESEYGIGHLWATAEFRANFGLHSDLDFTSNSVNAGFIFEF